MADKEYHLKDVSVSVGGPPRTEADRHRIVNHVAICRPDISKALTTLDNEGKVLVKDVRMKLVGAYYETPQGDKPETIYLSAQEFIDLGMRQVIVQEYKGVRSKKSQFLRDLR